jgi:hypothetical protein
MKILGAVPPLVALPMVVPPSSFLSVLNPIFDDNLKMLSLLLEHDDTMMKGR